MHNIGIGSHYSQVCIWLYNLSHLHHVWKFQNYLIHILWNTNKLLTSFHLRMLKSKVLLLLTYTKDPFASDGVNLIVCSIQWIISWWTCSTFFTFVTFHTWTAWHSVSAGLVGTITITNLINWIIADWNRYGSFSLSENMTENPLGSIRTHQDPSGPIRIHQDPSGSIRTHQDPLGSIRIHQHPLGSIRIHQDLTNM